MNFTLSEEQVLMADSVRHYLDKAYPFSTRIVRTGTRHDRHAAAWQDFAGLGLLGLLIPPQYDGMGMGAAELALVMQEFGRRLVIEPYLETAVLAATILRDGADETQRRALLPAIAAGESLMALAHDEAHTRYGLGAIHTQAIRCDDGYRLRGKKVRVVHGDSAQQLIVSARLASSGQDSLNRSDLGLFLVDTAARGLVTHSYALIDGRRAADFDFDLMLPADALLNTPGAAPALLDDAQAYALMGVIWEAVGAMNALYENTLAYARTRKQFGVPLGSFQVLQHRLVDMFIHLEQARSAAWMALMHLESQAPRTRRLDLSIAKLQIGTSARFIGQQAIQIHGGMGMTHELDIGHYFKRLIAIEQSMGNAEHHLDLLAAADRQPAGV